MRQTWSATINLHNFFIMSIRPRLAQIFFFWCNFLQNDVFSPTALFKNSKGRIYIDIRQNPLIFAQKVPFFKLKI